VKADQPRVFDHAGTQGRMANSEPLLLGWGCGGRCARALGLGLFEASPDACNPGWAACPNFPVSSAEAQAWLQDPVHRDRINRIAVSCQSVNDHMVTKHGHLNDTNPEQARNKYDKASSLSQCPTVRPGLYRFTTANKLILEHCMQFRYRSFTEQR
jgi:hypothetical protein